MGHAATTFAAVAMTVAVAIAGHVAPAGAMDPAAAPGSAPAAKPAAAAAKPSAPPTPAARALAKGIAAYEGNKLARAVGALSSALSTGGLTSNEMARALYFRGLSHRKQGRPAQAISDLTGAIWLADGLDEKDRGAAVAARALAYKDAGLPDPGAPQTAAATAVPAPVPAAPPASHSSAKRAEPAPAADGSWQTSATPRAATVAQAEEPAAAAPSSGGGIAGFFSNLFGGGESSPPAAPSPGNVTTSSTGTPPNSAVSSWSTETAATRAAPAAAPAVKRTRTAAIADSPPPPAPAVAAKPALTGKYKLQVAVVRSRAEADRVLGELTAKHAAKLGARHAVVEEAVFGNMGTFFRVNVGPFATAAESGKVCDALRPGGYDCLVVTQ